MNNRHINITVAIIGFIISAFFTFFMPINHAESIELNYVNSEMQKYKSENNLKYVDLEDPVFKSILNEGNNLFLSNFQNKVLLHLSILALILAIIGIFIKHLHCTAPIISVTPSFFAVMFSGQNPIFWIIAAVIACSGIYIRTKLK